MAVISARSRALVQLDAASHQVHQATDASMFGPDSSQWPAWWFDVVSTLQMCRVEAENARVSAEVN